MKHHLLLLYLLFSTSLLYTCRNCPEGKRTYTPIDPVVKSYFGFFGPGSYWVFRDSISQKIDTFYLMQYRKLDNIRRFSGFRDCNYFDELHYTIEGRTNRMSFSIDNERGYAYFMNNNFKYKDGVFSSGGATDPFRPFPVFDSLTIQGKTYRQVVEFPAYSFYIYFSPNVGLIKLKSNDFLLELIDFKIVSP